MSASASTLNGAGAQASSRLPVAGLLALAMTGFIAILTETLPAGLLPQISGGASPTRSPGSSSPRTRQARWLRRSR